MSLKLPHKVHSRIGSTLLKGPIGNVLGLASEQYSLTTIPKDGDPASRGSSLRRNVCGHGQVSLWGFAGYEEHITNLRTTLSSTRSCNVKIISHPSGQKPHFCVFKHLPRFLEHHCQPIADYRKFFQVSSRETTCR